MKEVKLLKLELTNYRNIDHEVYVFGGKNAKIVGENRIGKTNTLEAIYFLLTNYLLDGSSDLTQLKPLADTKRVVSVKGTFEVWETTTQHIPPREITLEKRYEEEWVKTRGTTDLVLKGHAETYIFNGIEQSKSGDYYDLLEEYFGIRNDKKGEVDVIQMLCNPLYIGNLGDSKDWTNLRAFIIKVIGDVTDDEVFEAEPTTKLVKTDLDKALGKTDQVKKMYENDIKGINLSINAHNANIDLLERTEKPINVDLAREGLEITNKKMNELFASMDDNKVIENYEKEIFATKKKVLELNTKEYSEWQSSQIKGEHSKVDELNAELEKALDNATDIKFKLSNAQSDKRMAEVHISSCTHTREEYAKRFNEIKDKKNDVDSKIETVCPTCHRPLDEAVVKQAKEEYLARLDEELEEVAKEGKANTEELNKYKLALESANDQVSEYEKQLDEANKVIDGIKEKLEVAKSELGVDSGENKPFVESKELKEMRETLASLENELSKAKEEDSISKTKTTELIEVEKQKLIGYQKVLDDFNYYERQMQVLDNVREEKAKCCKELADLEQKKECLELFNYTKLRLLDTHVAHVFGDIKFQLVRENINGGFDPVCKPYIFDVDNNKSTSTIWKSGSKSEKIVTGIAIAEHIKSHLGLSSLPFLFDEGGEVSSETLFNRLKTEAQIICVKVEDKINKPVVVNF